LLSVSTGPTQVPTRDSLDRSAGGFYDVSTIDKTINVTLSASFKTSQTVIRDSKRYYYPVTSWYENRSLYQTGSRFLG